MSIITKALEKAERERAHRQGTDHKNERDIPVGMQKTRDRSPKKRSAGKTALILIVLLVAAVSIGGGIFLMDRQNGTERTDTTPDRAAASPETAGPAKTAEKDRETSSSPPNPLSFLSKNRKAAEETVPSLPRLNGIMYTPDPPKAIIDGSIHKKGDRVREFVIKDILPDKVILNDGNEDIELQVR